MSDIKVGDEFWVKDENHRIYDNNTSFGGGPIYERYFIKTKIISETSRSWVVGYGNFKVPKKRPFDRVYTSFGLPKQIYTDEMKADDIWLNSHAYKIKDKVDACSVEQLRQIADIIGYKE